jgi:hypothetical protein
MGVAGGQFFGKDKHGVFYETYKIAGADPETFEPFPRSLYARDRNAVYFSGTRIVGADPESFQVLSSSYAKDNGRAYYNRKPIEDADVGSFEALENGQEASKDKNYGCARDRSHVYCYGEIKDGRR